MLDRPQQFRVLLANDLVKLGGLHPGLDQLLEGLAGFDALMLANVADEQHAVAGIDLGEEVAHLLGAGKARLIDHVQMPVWGGLLAAGEEALQGVGGDASVAELMRGAGGRGKAFHDVAALFGGFPHCLQRRRFSHSGASL